MVNILAILYLYWAILANILATFFSTFSYYICYTRKTNNMEAVKTFDLPNNRKLQLIQDDHADSPRTWDNLCKMIFIGKYSHLGDKHDFNGTYNSFEEHQKAIEKELDVAYIAPVYAYSHSGMTISLTPFNDRWDSGVLGWVVITKKDLRENYSVKRLTKAIIEKGISHAESEIEILDQYIRGDVYGFKVIKVEKCNKGCEHEEEEDSCWGFYGDDINENGILDHLPKEDADFIKQLEVA